MSTKTIHRIGDASKNKRTEIYTRKKKWGAGGRSENVRRDGRARNGPVGWDG